MLEYLYDMILEGGAMVQIVLGVWLLGIVLFTINPDQFDDPETSEIVKSIIAFSLFSSFLFIPMFILIILDYYFGFRW